MAEPRRGDVLVVRRRLGFGGSGRREHFVVLQSDMLQRDLDTVVVAPMDDALPLYASDPLVVHVSKREAGTAARQVVLVSHLSSVLRERFEPMRAGRLRASSMSDIGRLVAILLEL